MSTAHSKGGNQKNLPALTMLFSADGRMIRWLLRQDAVDVLYVAVAAVLLLRLDWTFFE